MGIFKQPLNQNQQPNQRRPYNSGDSDYETDNDFFSRDNTYSSNNYNSNSYNSNNYNSNSYDSHRDYDSRDYDSHGGDDGD